MVTMTKQKLFNLNGRAVFLLCGLLLCSQISALEHNAEHFSHGHQELCHNFMAYDGSANELTSYDLIVSPITHGEFYTVYSVFPSLDAVRFSPIRAPPQSV